MQSLHGPGRVDSHDGSCWDSQAFPRVTLATREKTVPNCTLAHAFATSHSQVLEGGGERLQCLHQVGTGLIDSYTFL